MICHAADFEICQQRCFDLNSVDSAKTSSGQTLGKRRSTEACAPVLADTHVAQQPSRRRAGVRLETKKLPSGRKRSHDKTTLFAKTGSGQKNRRKTERQRPCFLAQWTVDQQTAVSTMQHHAVPLAFLVTSCMQTWLN